MVDKVGARTHGKPARLEKQMVAAQKCADRLESWDVLPGTFLWRTAATIGLHEMLL